jgi:hypothetical protein
MQKVKWNGVKVKTPMLVRTRLTLRGRATWNIPNLNPAGIFLIHRRSMRSGSRTCAKRTARVTPISDRRCAITSVGCTLGPNPPIASGFGANFTQRNPWLTNPDRLREAIRSTVERSCCPDVDVRRALIELCAYYHVAILIGLEPNTLLEEIAASCTIDASRILWQFAARAPEDKDIEKFRWEAIRDDRGKIIIRDCG